MKSRNPEFTGLLKIMQEVHDKKSHDYADDTNVFSNFEFAGEVASVFNDPTDKAFAVLIGVKLARLAQLKNGKTAKNENVEDTHLDMTNYCAIWASKTMKEAKQKK